MTTRQKWRPPSDAELAILRRELGEAEHEGREMETRADTRLPAVALWVQRVLGLITRALGPDHWPGVFTDAVRGPLPEQLEIDTLIFTEEGNLRLGRSRLRRCLAVFPEIYRELDLVAELAQVAPTEARDPAAVDLPPEEFTFVKCVALRTIARRDYGELRRVAQFRDTTKARVVLAGAVIEAMLLDLFTDSSGFPPHTMWDLPLGPLFSRAASARLVSDKASLAVPAVKDFRNLGHPGVELKLGELASTDADIAIALAKSLIAERKSP